MRRHRDPPPPPARAVAHTESDFIQARDALVRAAVKFGKQQLESEKVARGARTAFDKALAELRRSEQREGVNKACEAITYALTIARHSTPNSAHTPDYEQAVKDAIKRLKGGGEE